MNIQFEPLYILMAGLLLLSFFFLSRISSDSRYKRSRFNWRTVKQTAQKNISKFENEKYDVIFKKVGLPDWLTSTRYNIVRGCLLLYGVFGLLFHFILNIEILSPLLAVIVIILVLFLEPKSPFPAYYILLSLRKHFMKVKNNEIYLLFNELKSEVQSKGDNVENLYHLMRNMSPYYKILNRTFEKMLPYLRDQKYEEAWDLFRREVATEEADKLAELMKDFEYLTAEEALRKLNLHSEEFAKSMYEEYKKYLVMRRGLIFGVVSAGAVFVFLVPVAAFWGWYQDIKLLTDNFMN